MAQVKPFAALRPNPELAARICELPYDVMSTEEARQIADGNPLSFLHVSKPEIDLPASTDPYAPEVYARGAENFQRLIVQGALRQDTGHFFYLYRQIMGRHSQTGLVAAASCEDYLNGIIKKHELTRPEKEEDRIRHIEALNSQTGPVFLVYRANRNIHEFIARKSAEPPGIDFTAKDGVRHSAWLVAEATDMQFLEAEFGGIPALYIADGHHRSAAAAGVFRSRRSWHLSGDGSSDRSAVAARVFRARQGAGESGFFLSVIFPDNQVQILPYNRVLKDLNGLAPQKLLGKLEAVFEIKADGDPTPLRKHELGLYLAGRWHTLTFRPRVAATSDPVESLDATLLQKHVLDPIFGIADPRTSKRINFVGGIRGTSELEKLVQSGDYACAFSLFPTSIGDLMAIADAGGIMPPKSTWFEPKLRDA